MISESERHEIAEKLRAYPDDGHSCGGKASEEWLECPHCCSKLRVWDEWHGCTIWSGGEPLWGGLFCPVCGQRLGDEERMMGDGSD